MARWFIAALVVLSSCAATVPGGPFADPSVPQLLRIVRRAEAEGVVRGVVVVVHTDRLLLRTTSQEPAAVDTRAVFRIASVGKALTAVAAIEMSRAGLIAMDRPVVVQWPEAAGLIGAEVTPEHLLTMTSGLSRELRTEPGCCLLPLDPSGRAAPALTAHPRLDQHTPPGTVWRYSNVGYWVAGGLMEVVAGSTYAEAVRRHVLDPAGMDHTYFGDPPPGVALATPGAGFGNSAIIDPRGRFASGGWTSTADDLVDLCRYLGRLRWGEDDIDLLRRSAIVAPGRTGNALMWSGSQPGTASALWCEPAGPSAVVVLSQVEPSRPEALLTVVADLVGALRSAAQ